MTLARIFIPFAALGFCAVPAQDVRPEFEVAVQTNVMVSMRDGVKLATDVYLPAKEGQPVAGKHPAILVRTPYNKNGEKGNATYFVTRGYAFVAPEAGASGSATTTPRS